MSNILLQTTIAEHPDDWDITRFSLLAGLQRLRAQYRDLVASCDRTPHPGRRRRGAQRVMIERSGIDLDHPKS
jgi:hypothetical protein